MQNTLFSADNKSSITRINIAVIINHMAYQFQLSLRCCFYTGDLSSVVVERLLALVIKIDSRDLSLCLNGTVIEQIKAWDPACLSIYMV